MKQVETTSFPEEEIEMFEHIKRRDGKIVKFDPLKITAAIAKAAKATGEFKLEEARALSSKVLELAHSLSLGPVPEVEGIQDAVERVLIESPYHQTAKAYILYREHHAQIRDMLAKANVQLVENYIEKLDWKVRENSNMPKNPHPRRCQSGRAQTFPSACKYRAGLHSGFLWQCPAPA
jgi:anaerobic ribonucleoside-triphosphate reductase